MTPLMMQSQCSFTGATLPADKKLPGKMQDLLTGFPPDSERTVTSLIYMESCNVQDLISVPHSTLDIRDPNAMAVLIMLHSKPEGSTVSGKAVMDFFSIGRTRFYKARKILLDQNLITEIKKHNREGHFPVSNMVWFHMEPRTRKRHAAYPKTTTR